MMQQPPPQGQPMPSAAPQGQPPVTIDAVMALLRDGAMRRFRIDIEVDSTIAGDESQERQDRTMFIEATTKFVQAWGPIVAGNGAMAQLAGELLLFGTRAFRVGRALEEVIEETVDKLEQQAAQPKPPPQPSPDEMVKLEGTKAKVGAEVQKSNASIQETQVKAQGDQASQKMELVGKVLEHQHTVAEHDMSARQMDREEQQAEREHERKMELIDHQAKQAKKKPDGK